MAVAQIQQQLKFELLIPIRAEDTPTACMSFNYHRDHFGLTWGLLDHTGEVAHTGCVAFGMDRLAVALFRTHGIDLAAGRHQSKKRSHCEQRGKLPASVDQADRAKCFSSIVKHSQPTDAPRKTLA